MTSRYNLSSGFANEYQFCLDWNLTPHNVWTKPSDVFVCTEGKTIYIPFFVYFNNQLKSIYIF